MFRKWKSWSITFLLGWNDENRWDDNEPTTPTTPSPSFLRIFPPPSGASEGLVGSSTKCVMSFSRVTLWQALQPNRSDWHGLLGGQWWEIHHAIFAIFLYGFFVNLIVCLWCATDLGFFAVQSTQGGFNSVAMAILIVIFPSKVPAYEQACNFLNAHILKSSMQR